MKECAICFNKIEKNNKIKLKCYHSFCATCIISNTLNKQISNCPLCRTNICKSLKPRSNINFYYEEEINSLRERHDKYVEDKKIELDIINKKLYDQTRNNIEKEYELNKLLHKITKLKETIEDLKADNYFLKKKTIKN